MMTPVSKLERFISPEPIVLPWVFGKTVYNRLKSLHDDLDLSKYDFLIEHEGDTQKDRFSCQYRVSPIATQPNTPAPFIESSWKNHPDLDQILGKAQTISENIKSYIALDLEEHRIKDIIEQPLESIREPLGPPQVRSSAISISSRRSAAGQNQPVSLDDVYDVGIDWGRDLATAGQNQPVSLDPDDQSETP